MKSFGSMSRKNIFFTKGTSRQEQDDISNFRDTALSMDISAKETSGRAVIVSLDGTKIYVLGSASNQIHQYDLSTAYKIDTASFTASYDVAPELVGSCYGFFIKPDDGAKLYVIGSNNDTVFQYTLSTGWDISTATYDTKSFSVANETGSPRKVVLNSNGTKMYILASDKTLFQYALSTPWDASTASILQHVHLNEFGGTEAYCVFFNLDGTKLYGCGSDCIIRQYNLNTGWDLSTAVYAGKYMNISTVDTATWGICFSSSMAYMYVIGSGSDKVYELESKSTRYNLGNFTTTTVWTNNFPANGAMSIDSTNVWTNSTALKVTSLNTTELSVQTAISQNIPGANKDIRFAFYLHNAVTKYSSIYVYLTSTPAWSKFFYFNFKDLTLVQGWNFIHLTNKSAWGNAGSENWYNAFVILRIKFTSADAGELGAITFDSVTAGI